MKGTLIILQVRNANHDNEKFIVKAMNYDRAAEDELNRLDKEIKKANDKFWQTLSDGDECYLAADYTEEVGNPIYAIVHNELSNCGSGVGIYGVASSEKEAIESYKNHIKRQDDYWLFDDKPAMEKLDETVNGGILFQDTADSDLCSMEFACVRLIPNGNSVEVNF